MTAAKRDAADFVREEGAERFREYVDQDIGDQRKRKNSAPKDDGKASPISPVSAGALKAMTFAPIKYVVPDVLVEGLTLLAGKPKVGKSWLLLNTAIAVASGGFTLGNLYCTEGDVLYCALEDNERRLQSRITKLLGIAADWPERLFYYTELPRLAEGGLDRLRDWIKSVPHPRLIIVDTLAMVRAMKQRDESNYASDYASVLELRQMASEYGIAIVVVHHLRKAIADDPFDTISGTLGLTGAPDTILVLTRESGSFVLHGRGRDLIEIEKAMTFDRDACIWRITGDAAEMRRSAERNAILGAIREAGEAIGPNDIAATINMKATNVRFLLGKLLKEGLIRRAGYGRYRPTTLSFDDQTIEDRGGAISTKPFTASVGKKVDVPCIHCHVKDGAVFKIKDGRLGKGQGHYEALHKACAEDFYSGKPSPETTPGDVQAKLEV